MNGPSFTSSTSISAPNSPSAVRTPSASIALATRSHRGLATSGAARVREPRPASARGVRVERELADDERLAAHVEQRAVRPTVVILEDPQLADPARQRVGRRLVIVVAHAEQDEEAGPDRLHEPALHADLGAADPLQERAHAPA